MKRRVALSLDADLLERVDAHARELGQSRTTFVERALESTLDFEDRLPQPPTSPRVQLADGRAMHRAALARQAKLNKAKDGKR